MNRESPEIPNQDGKDLTVDNSVATSSEISTILRARAKVLALEPNKVPAAGSSTDSLTFFLAHETYAIETLFIREVYPLNELTPLPCTPGHILGIINLRGTILTIIDIKRFFNLPEKGITNLNRVIVVQNDVMELGILADEIIGIRNIPAATLHPPMVMATSNQAGYIKGVGDGLILLDMDMFFNDKQLIVHQEV